MPNIVVGTLRALLTLDKAEFDKGIREVDRSLTAFSRTSASIARQSTALGRSLTTAVTLPLVAAGIAITKFASDFESAFTGVRKTVDATEPEFQMLAQGFRDLAKEIPVSVEELLKIGEAAGQLGIETENIVEFSRVMAELGVTTNLTSEQAATSLARLANITGLQQDQFRQLGSAVVDLGNNFETTEAEIVDFGLRIASAGEIVGLTEGEILGIGTAFSSVGVAAERGGTAVQKVLVEMAKAVSEGGESLRLFAQTAGLSVEQFAEAFRTDAAGAFAAFVEGLGRQGDQAFATLEALSLQDQRLVQSFLAVANAGDLLSEAIGRGNQAFGENEALTREAALRFDTLRSQATLLWNRLKDLGITIGVALIPAMKSAIAAADSFLPILEGLANAFARLPGSVQLTVIGLAAVAAAIGPILLLVGQLFTGLSAMATAFTAGGIAVKAFGLVIAALSNPITATIALLAGAGGLIAALTAARRAIDNLNQSSLSDRRQGQLERQKAALDGLVRAINAQVAATGEASEALIREAQAKQDSIRILEAQIRAQDAATEETDAATDASQTLEEQIRALITGVGAFGDATTATTQDISHLIAAERDLVVVGERVSRTFDSMFLGIGQSFLTLREGTVESQAALRGVAGTLDHLLVPVAEAERGLAALHNQFGAIGRQLEAEAPPTFFQTLGSQVRNFFRDDLGPLILGAIQGGGDIARAIGAGIFENLFSAREFLGSRIQQFLSSTLGQSIGGAIGSIIPGLGTLIGSTLGGLIGDLFSFGGPSEAELQGRALSNRFIDGFVAEANVSSDRIAAAVAQGWDARLAEFALAVQDLFVESGQSAEEGLAAVQTLFDSIAEGPEATQAAIDAIQAVVGEIEQWEQAAMDAERATSDLAAAVSDREQILADVLDQGVSAFERFRQSGLAAGVEVPQAFRAMLEASRLLEGQLTGPVIQGAIAAGDALKSLDTLGQITGRNFAQFGASVKAAFDQLLAGGASSEAALEALRQPLAQLIFLQERHGFAIDAGTQAILDQARQYGITAAEGQSAADKQIEALDKVIAALELVIERLGGVQQESAEISNTPAIVNVDADTSDLDRAFSKIPSQINVPVNFKTGGISLPRIPGVPRLFQTGTPNLDFADFGPRALIEAHGREAIIPQGGGHQLAEEIAAALGPVLLSRQGEQGVTVQIGEGAVRVDGASRDVGRRILASLSEALQGGGLEVTRFLGAVKAQA